MKSIRIIIFFLFVPILLVGCKKETTSAEFDPYINRTKKIIETLDEKDYENFKDMVKEEFRENYGEEFFKNLESILEEKGKFKEFKDHEFSRIDEKEEKFFTVVHRVSYEKEDAIFEISYDENMNITDFNLK